MSDAEMVQTIKTQTLSLMADMTANPKPSYTLDGQRISWSEYLAAFAGRSPGGFDIVHQRRRYK